MVQKMSATIPYLPDILIRGEDGEMIAFVQVKNARVLSRDVALALYRDVIVESAAASAPYFLLLSQRLGFLWEQHEDSPYARSRRGAHVRRPTSLKRQEEADADVAPAVEFAMDGVIHRYLPDLSEGVWLHGRELDFIVSQWLFSLATEQQSTVGEPEKALADAGFLAAIEGAAVTIEPSGDVPAASHAALAV